MARGGAAAGAGPAHCGRPRSLDSPRPLLGTAGEVYFRRARTISAPLAPTTLRFHAAAPVYPYRLDGPTCPAVVAAVTDSRGLLTGVHLTYLRPDGSGKADLQPNRKMVGVIAGAHVRLIAGRQLVIGEGLESTLSAWEAAARELGHAEGLGASAGLSAGGVAAFRWPAGTAALVIAPDRDPGGAGETGCRTLARRATAHGLRVNFLPPPGGFSDWNDAAQARRAGAR